MSSIRSLLAMLRQPSSATDSDRMLLARYASTGDEEAFAALVNRHGSLVLGVCRRTIRDVQLAEDAFQAVFIVLARKAGNISVRESLANWLYVVARRIAVKAAKKVVRSTTIDDVAAPASTNCVESVEIQQIIDEELSRLPAKYRSPLIAFHIQERTQDETATMLGWSLSTVRRRLDEGRELLRERLSTRGVTLGIGAILTTTTLPTTLANAAVSLATTARSGGTLSPHLLQLAHEGLPMKKIFLSLAVCVTAVVGVGMAVIAGDPPKPKEEVKLVAAPVAQNAKWSTIKGQVLWGGATVAAQKLSIVSDKEHCLSKGDLVSDELIVNAKNNGLKNTWVYLLPESENRNAKFTADQIHPDLVKPKSKEHAVDQPCCQFVPRILAVREGDTILFKNSSPIPHNVNYKPSGDNVPFNVTLAAGASKKTEPLISHRYPEQFECNVHPWMKGMVMIFDHPYFAVTDADGNFEIKNAPVGKFRIMYRHELGYHKGREGAKGLPVTITGPTMTLEALKYEAPQK